MSIVALVLGRNQSSLRTRAQGEKFVRLKSFESNLKIVTGEIESQPTTRLLGLEILVEKGKGRFMADGRQKIMHLLVVCELTRSFPGQTPKFLKKFSQTKNKTEDILTGVETKVSQTLEEQRCSRNASQGVAIVEVKIPKIPVKAWGTLEQRLSFRRLSNSHLKGEVDQFVFFERKVSALKIANFQDMTKVMNFEIAFRTGVPRDPVASEARKRRESDRLHHQKVIIS
jgi:hypothetical protein